MKRTEITRRYPTPALEKGLDVLELFATESTGLTKTEVARRLGRTVSEVFRMLACLEARGYIARSGSDGRYSLTLHLFKLVHQNPPIERLATEAMPIMRHLTAQINQSCHLGVLDGDRVVIIAQVNSPLSSGFTVKSGGIGDLMRSTTGQVILAYQTPHVASRSIKLWCKHNGMRPPSDLDRHLKDIKEHGFDERKSYEVEGVTNISFPVWDDRGCAIAALSVPFLKRIGDSTNFSMVKRALEKASYELSEAIGGVPIQQN
jgi:DNA-binding IclR family transcriptional regulator